MKLNRSDIIKLENFLADVRLDVYPEPATDLHAALTRKMIGYVLDRGMLKPGSKILDIGCGQGVALALFAQYGASPVGITLGREDLAVCRQRGFEVYEMDQSFLDFADNHFDFIWCRHCLEHSVFPFFTLSELFRVLKPRSCLYIEVPAPDTECNHQANRNHYSVLGKSMWQELITRAGFHILDVLELNFDTAAGPDTYYSFIQQKP